MLTKSMPMVTLYVLSNVSYMKRVMMLVLPTASSPRKTSLYLERGTIGALGAVAEDPPAPEPEPDADVF